MCVVSVFLFNLKLLAYLVLAFVDLHLENNSTHCKMSVALTSR